MLTAFLLAAMFPSATAGVLAVGADYDAECSVVLEDELPEQALFLGWWESPSGTRGLGDGAYFWMVAGWEPYGYQQGITPWSASSSIQGWGWGAVLPGEGAEVEVQQLTVSCLSGSTAAADGSPDPFGTGLSILAEDASGRGMSWAADRVRFDDGQIEISCGASGWEDGVELTVTLSWIRSAA